MLNIKRLFLIMFTLLMLITALGPVVAQDNTVTMIVTRDPISLDPQGTLDPGAPVLLAYIYDTLVYQAADGTVLPSLAESWTVSDDQLAITFNLRQDIVFSDGSPLNADAVIFTFERLQEVGERSLIYDDVANVSTFEKVDDYTVTFHLSKATATLLSALTYPYGGILSPAAVKAAGENYGQNPVGTGPFVLEDWIPESELTMVPNPNYAGHRPWVDVDGPPAIDHVRVRFSRDEAARANALLAGEADIIYLSSGSQLARLEGNDDFYSLDSPGRALTFVGFNTQRPPFDNVDVRQAIAKAINKEDILLLAAEGLGEIVDAMLPPSIFSAGDQLADDAVVYDPAAARAQLEESGVGPINLTILTSTYPAFQVIATILQAELAEIGITAEVEVLDFAAVREMAIAGDYDVLVTRYDWNDPDVLRRYLGTEMQGDTNRYFYSVPEVDALFAEGLTTFDPEAREAIYVEVQRILLHDLPIIPLYMPNTKVIVNKRVENVSMLHSHVVMDAAQVTD